MSAACHYPGCEHVGNGRPYARKRDMPSSSGIAGSWDDGKARSFAWSASLIAATTAIHDQDGTVAELGTGNCGHTKDTLCPACRYVRSQFDRDWTAKADLGTHIHHLAQSWTQGEAVDVDDVSGGYMDAVEAFFVDHRPDWVEVERTILYDKPIRHGYRGQFDWIAEINCPTCGMDRRCRWLGDWKSGRYSPASQTLQLASYRHAQHLTDWTDGVETVVGKVPAVAHAGVVLLAGDGSYQLVELPANAEAHNTFLRLRDAWGWHKQMKKWEREHPLPDTTTIQREEAA